MLRLKGQRSGHLHQLLIVIIERFPIFPVVEGRHANDLLLLVDDWQRQDVFDGPAAAVQRLRLQRNRPKRSERLCPDGPARLTTPPPLTWNSKVSSAAAFMMLQI